MDVLRVSCKSKCKQSLVSMCCSWSQTTTFTSVLTKSCMWLGKTLIVTYVWNPLVHVVDTSSPLGWEGKAQAVWVRYLPIWLPVGTWFSRTTRPVPYSWPDLWYFPRRYSALGSGRDDNSYRSIGTSIFRTYQGKKKMESNTHTLPPLNLKYVQHVSMIN